MMSVCVYIVCVYMACCQCVGNQEKSVWKLQVDRHTHRGIRIECDECDSNEQQVRPIAS